MRLFASLPPPPKPPLRPPAPPLTVRPAKSSHAPRRNAHVGTAAKQDAPAQQASVIGRWQEPGGSDLVEFRADGALIEQSAGGDKIQGRYLLGGDELKIQLEGVDHLAFTIAVDAHTLELRDADGHVTRYQRLL